MNVIAIVFKTYSKTQVPEGHNENYVTKRI